jgi:hypothetical protein
MNMRPDGGEMGVAGLSRKFWQLDPTVRRVAGRQVQVRDMTGLEWPCKEVKEHPVRPAHSYAAAQDGKPERAA